MDVTDQKPGVLEEATIIDTDVHLSMHWDEIASYAAPEAEHYIGNELNANHWGTTEWDIYMNGKLETVPLTGPEEVEAFKRDFHVDYPLLNMVNGSPPNPQSRYATEMMRAANDYLLDVYLDDYDNYGYASLAPQVPDKAAEEIDRVAAEEGIVGCFICNTGRDLPLGDPSYDIMYRAAEDNDLPVVFHADAADKFKYQFPMQNKELNKFLQIHTLTHLWCHTQTLTSLVTEGVMEKFPHLDFVFVEADFGWVPYMMYRLNKEYSIRRSEAPLLEKSPEQYIRESCYFSSQPIGEPERESDIESLIDLVGMESLVFSSDYPHWDFDHPEALDKHLRRTYDGDERERMLFENAREIFDIPV